MSVFKRRVLSLVVMLSIAISFSACGGGSGSSNDDPNYIGKIVFAKSSDKNITIYFNNSRVTTKITTSPNDANQYTEGLYELDSEDRVIANSWKKREVVSDSVVQVFDYEVLITYNNNKSVNTLTFRDENATTALNYTYNIYQQVIQVDINQSKNNSDDILTFTYDNNATDAKPIRSTWDDDSDGIDNIYDYNYTDDGYITQYTDDNNADGTPDQAWRFIYDANNTLVMIENDHGNDGDTDSNNTIVNTDTQIIYYDTDGDREFTITYSDNTEKTYAEKFFYGTDHEMVLNIELLKIYHLVEGLLNSN